MVLGGGIVVEFNGVEMIVELLLLEILRWVLSGDYFRSEPHTAH